ncbi:hypothetical protein T265_08255 [Opisthorchis viverrini]|uniref:Uncharacterized protein n=1 Tax=Opisthorchis viverrini TaxID=6198 RepID=A0A074Z9P6_OPIVI|nr:hypothetical protein T265_08255 [Opisthorchis viverrini]KER23956.1 hypothetical protein T265_08255 [Opisthorchis viverrini]
MPQKRSTRAGILAGCPSLDGGSRGAGFVFEPRTLRPPGDNSRQAEASFRYLATMPSEGNTTAEILLGCPTLDRSSRDAEAAFEP